MIHATVSVVVLELRLVESVDGRSVEFYQEDMLSGRRALMEFACIGCHDVYRTFIKCEMKLIRLIRCISDA
jgi:hypothetical protein